IWFAPLAAPLLTASVPDPVIQGTPLKLITFNVYPYNQRLTDAAAWLKLQDADVILLQEIPEETPEALTALFDSYPHTSIIPGYAILSRYPVLSEEPIALAESSVQQITLEINGQTLTLFNVHLAFPVQDTPH